MQPRIGEVLEKSFKDFYGNLEKVLLANLIWSFSLIPVISVLMIKGFSSGLFLLPFLGISILLLSVVTGGAFSFMRGIAKGEPVDYLDIWREGKRYFKESLSFFIYLRGNRVFDFLYSNWIQGKHLSCQFLAGNGNLRSYLFFPHWNICFPLNDRQRAQNMANN